MRKLNENERAHAKMIFEGNEKGQKVITGFFKIWGSIMIMLIIITMFSGEASKEEIPFMLIGCVLFYLIFFKFTSFLDKKSKWKILIKVLEEKKEFVYDCELVKTYKNRHGASDKGLVAIVTYNDKTTSAKASLELKDKEPGTKVCFICVQEDIYAPGFKYAMLPIDETNK